MPEFNRPLSSGDLRLLTAPEDDLSAADWDQALELAYRLGREAVDMNRKVEGDQIGSARPAQALPRASPRYYTRFFVRAAVIQRVIDWSAYDAWQEEVHLSPTRRDERVRRFLAGWEERGREIVAELSATKARSDAARG